MSDASDLLAELEQCERTVWDALVSGDEAADAAALDDGFVGVYADGFAGKVDHVGQLVNGPTVSRYALSELRTTPLGADYAALSYRADFLRTGRREASEVMYVTSIWRRAGEGWVNILSQDTPGV